VRAVRTAESGVCMCVCVCACVRERAVSGCANPSCAQSCPDARGIMGIGDITPGFQKVKLIARVKTSASQVRGLLLHMCA
jgi:hypothetical protein